MKLSVLVLLPCFCVQDHTDVHVVILTFAGTPVLRMAAVLGVFLVEQLHYVVITMQSICQRLRVDFDDFAHPVFMSINLDLQVSADEVADSCPTTPTLAERFLVHLDFGLSEALLIFRDVFMK